MGSSRQHLLASLEIAMIMVRRMMKLDPERSMAGASRLRSVRYLGSWKQGEAKRDEQGNS